MKILALLFLATTTFARLFTNPTQLTKASYDFIVVGGKAFTLYRIVTRHGFMDNSRRNSRKCRRSSTERESNVFSPCNRSWRQVSYSQTLEMTILRLTAAYICVSSDAGNEGVLIPFNAPNDLNNGSIIWNYTTVPQSALNNRVLPYQRGRILGGSSCLSGRSPLPEISFLFR